MRNPAPFAGMAGVWAGGGTVTLDDGSTERIRCRETSAVGAGGTGLNLTLVCASDSYKFDLRGDVISERGALTGTWSEASRNVSGTLEGRGGNGNFQVVANAAGFQRKSFGGHARQPAIRRRSGPKAIPRGRDLARASLTRFRAKPGHRRNR